MRWPTVDLEDLTERLRAFGCIAAEEEAVELLDAAGTTEQLEEFLRRRSMGEPLAWITGSVDFGGQPVRVDAGVYVPRFESVELSRRAADTLATAATHATGAANPAARALDLCTGSGAVASVLLHAAPTATVIGVDVDVRAARCARRNGIVTLVADATSALAFRPASFDVVTVVAPYVPHDQIVLLPRDVQRFEPRLALDGGVDGLDVLRRMLPSVGRLLRPAGRLFIELGGNQDQILRPVLATRGLEVDEIWHDGDGDLRGLAAHLI